MPQAPSSLTARRRDRERELIAATRRLFDERGMQHAPVEEIARAVGIARGLIYRHVASKEELYVLTVTDYLAELRGELRDAATTDDPIEGVVALLESYTGYCGRYPAFLDCSLSLMQRPAAELRATMSQGTWLRLGQAMASCLQPVIDVLRAGRDAGVFTLDDPDLTATVLWTQMLGAMHLVRSGVGVREAAPGVPEVFAVEADAVVEACVRSALATIGARRAGPR